MRRRLALATALLVLVPLRAMAQGESRVDTLPVLAVPHDPAFIFLGATPKVTSPATGRQLAVALATGVTPGGHIKPGIALAFQPRRLMHAVPRAEPYYGNALYRALINWEVSLGTVRTATDTGSTDFAMGMRFTPLDRADPWSVRAFVDSFQVKLARCLTMAAPGRRLVGAERRTGFRRNDQDEVVDSGRVIEGDSVILTVRDSTGRLVQLRGELRRLSGGAARSRDTIAIEDAFFTPGVRDGCTQLTRSRLANAWAREHWNDWAFSLGFAAGGHALRSELNQVHALGWSGWAAGAIPAGSGVGFQWQVQYDQRTAVDTVPAHGRTTAAVRGLVGGPTTQVFVELDVSRGRGTSTADPSAGLEWRVSESLWLSAGVGSAWEAATGKRKAVLIAGIRLASAGRPMAFGR